MSLMGRLAGAWLLTLAVIPVAATGQANDANGNVGTCEILKHPQEFNGRIVTLRGVVSIGFENFRLSASGCEPAGMDGIWLEYGKGPKRQPTTWCCDAITRRDPLQLVENADFRRFHHYLTAQRRGNGCYEGQCYLYRVTATITGRVDTAQPATCPSGEGVCCTGAFGHFGVFCTRLVIQRVSNVVADRTLNGQ